MHPVPAALQTDPVRPHQEHLHQGERHHEPKHGDRVPGPAELLSADDAGDAEAMSAVRPQDEGFHGGSVAVSVRYGHSDWGWDGGGGDDGYDHQVRRREPVLYFG
uniref:(northern house mosquito) hypothetical protein n=1 Tax=Culex pipiens TaxID=7175 RepID=A0A8D8B140_CULPI